MAKIKHAHKYRRVKLNENYRVFQCVKTGCGHFINIKLVVGQLAECWVCGEHFTMTQKSATLAKPHCSHCVRRPDRQRKIAPPREFGRCANCNTPLTDPEIADHDLCLTCLIDVESLVAEQGGQ